MDASLTARYFLKQIKSMQTSFKPHFHKFMVLLITLEVAVLPALADELPYKNPNLPVDERVTDLLRRMTLEEKVRQLDMYSGRNSLLKTNELFPGMTHARPDGQR